MLLIYSEFCIKRNLHLSKMKLSLSVRIIERNLFSISFETNITWHLIKRVTPSTPPAPQKSLAAPHRQVASYTHG